MSERDEDWGGWRSLYETQRGELLRWMDEAEHWRKMAKAFRMAIGDHEGWLREMCGDYRLPADPSVTSMREAITRYIHELRAAEEER